MNIEKNKIELLNSLERDVITARDKFVDAMIRLKGGNRNDLIDEALMILVDKNPSDSYEELRKLPEFLELKKAYDLFVVTKRQKMHVG